MADGQTRSSEGYRRRLTVMVRPLSDAVGDGDADVGVRDYVIGCMSSISGDQCVLGHWAPSRTSLSTAASSVTVVSNTPSSAATGNLSSGDVPAYTPGSLVALSEELVAMIRSRERGVSEAHYDWVNVRTGAMGSFMLPAAMQVVGAGPRGVALMRVTMPDGEMQVATVSLATLLSTR